MKSGSFNPLSSRNSSDPFFRRVRRLEIAVEVSIPSRRGIRLTWNDPGAQDQGLQPSFNPLSSRNSSDPALAHGRGALGLLSEVSIPSRRGIRLTRNFAATAATAHPSIVSIPSRRGIRLTSATTSIAGASQKGFNPLSSRNSSDRALRRLSQGRWFKVVSIPSRRGIRLTPPEELPALLHRAHQKFQSPLVEEFV